MFERHYDFVWRSLRRLGLERDAADDAAQEVFMVAARRLGDILVGSERAFLFGTAARLASDRRRGAERESARAGGPAEELAAPPADPEGLIDRRRARALLEHLLTRLPLELRTVFVLYELEGMTMAEISALLSIPQGTVASRLRRGRESFQASAALLAGASEGM